MKVRFSRTEQRIVDAMVKSSEEEVWDIEAVAEVAYSERPRDHWPEYWTSSVSAIMRSVMLKTSTRYPRIVRKSKLGRGNVAEYEVVRAAPRKVAKKTKKVSGRNSASARKVA